MLADNVQYHILGFGVGLSRQAVTGGQNVGCPKLGMTWCLEMLCERNGLVEGSFEPLNDRERSLLACYLK